MLFVPFYHIKISRVAGGIPPSLFVRLVLMVSPGTIDLDNCDFFFTLKCNVTSHRGNDTSKRLTFFYTCKCIDVEYQFCESGRVGLTLTGLIPPHYCACPKPELDFQHHISWSVLCSTSSCERNVCFVYFVE